MEKILTVLILTIFLVVAVEATAQQEKELVVLIPGWGGEVKQLAFLEENIPYSAVIKPRMMAPLHEAADSVVLQLEEKQLIGKEIILVGFSFGGLIARELAGRYPELKIKKIIQIGTPNGTYWMMPGFIFAPTESDTPVPIYIIAGEKSATKWYLREVNDGAVDVKSVFSLPPDLVKGSAIFPLSHLELINSAEVVRKILSWL